MYKIQFENSAFLAVDKPAPWLTVPGRVEDGRTVLGLELERESGIRLWPIHRLDFGVSGLVLFAKNAEAHREASLCFESHKIEKTYEAWTTGSVDPALFGVRQEWTSKLLRGKKRAYESPAGKFAVTEAVCEGQRREAQVSEAQVPEIQKSKAQKTDQRGALITSVLTWRLFPKTGRSHQLRYELFKRGCPIVGDVLYGSTLDYFKDALALRAVALNFSKCPELLAMGLPQGLSVAGLAEWTP